MTAAAVARDHALGRRSNKLTLKNREKVLRYREDGEKAFDDMVGRIKDLQLGRTNTGDVFRDKDR